MPDPVWYKSLYWRIAFGFVAMLAAVLVAQGLVMFWLTDRVVGWSAQTPTQLVTSVATDLTAALARNPSLDLDSYVRGSGPIAKVEEPRSPRQSCAPNSRPQAAPQRSRRPGEPKHVMRDLVRGDQDRQSAAPQSARHTDPTELPCPTERDARDAGSESCA